MSFDGKCVLSLESRRANETAELIRRHGGDPFVAPSITEIPIDHNLQAFSFAEQLIAGQFDMVIFLTGVGTKYLTRVVTSRHTIDEFTNALRKVTVVARGPKPSAALREMNVPVTVSVPEPNTWREIVAAIHERPERRIAVQEYGKPATELIDALRTKGAEVTPVPVYQYGLPDDLGALREAVRRLAANAVGVALFTTSQQIVHLLQVARQMGLEPQVVEGLRRSLIASIGPTTSEMLRDYGLEPDMEPTHPKLGILVKEASEYVRKTS
jgi:uroporphyrinogen-III synthase